MKRTRLWPSIGKTASHAISAVIVTAVAAGGCHFTPTPQRVETGDLAAFTQDGVTSRQAVLDRFGPPTFQLDGGRLMAYRIGRANSGAIHSLPSEEIEAPGQPRFPNDQYSLVLVFDPSGTLNRHSVVTLLP